MKNTLIVLYIAAAMFFASCNVPGAKNEISLSAETIIDSIPGSCPFLTEDEHGNVVLSWIRHADSSSFIYCYAISKDNGKTFGKSVDIPASTNVHDHPENLPKIIFKPSGEIIAAWGAANPNPKNAYSGLVFYAQSFDEGKNWTAAKRLVTDTAGIDQRYFDMALMSDGEAGIIWLDNRMKTGKEGSSLFFAATNGNTGFQNEKKIGGPCCECCRTDIFTDSKKNIHALYRAIINDSIRDMVHAVSSNGGNSFSKPQRISNDNWVINGCPHTGPAMAENANGLQFTWFTAGSGTGVFYDHSDDNGNTYTQKDMVSGRAARHSQIVTLSNDDIVIVWDENFQKNNKIFSRIGVQERTPTGKEILKKYITADTSHASYPVVQSLDNDQLIIAYCKSIKDKSYVYYERSN